MTYIDIMNIKKEIERGRLAAKINMFGSILLEDTMTCEAVKLMQMPEGWSFHTKGEWQPTTVYTSNNLDNCTQGVDGWECSECGYSTLERTSWCADCGADMRESIKRGI